MRRVPDVNFILLTARHSARLDDDRLGDIYSKIDELYRRLAVKEVVVVDSAFDTASNSSMIKGIRATSRIPGDCDNPTLDALHRSVASVRNLSAWRTVAN